MTIRHRILRFRVPRVLAPDNQPNNSGGSSPVSQWRARWTSLVNTRRTWLAIALLFAFAGVFAGFVHQTPHNGSNPSNSDAATAVWTLGGASEAFLGGEGAHERAFTQPKGHPGAVPFCPSSDDTASTLTTTISASGALVLQSHLHVTMTAVTPAHPPLDIRDWLQRPQGTERLALCFVYTRADVTSLQWADGRLDADIDLIWDDATGYLNKVVTGETSMDHATVSVDLCAMHPEFANVRPNIAMCHIGAKNTVDVRVKRPIQNLQSTPFPNTQQLDGDYFDTTWKFDGPMPRLDVMLDAPKPDLIASWLRWNRNQSFAVPRGSVSVDTYYIVDTSAVWLALAVTAALLRGKHSSSGLPLHSSRRLLLVVLGGAVFGLNADYLWHLNSADAITVIIAWAILSVAVAPKRLRPVVGGLTAMALAPLALLATVSLTQTQADLLVIWLSVALIALVITAACLLWLQIRTLFLVAHVDADTSEWERTYRRLIDALMLAAFTLAIGFPVGQELNKQHYQVSGIDELARNLIDSTGNLFRPLLGWVSVLLAISYLTGYLIDRARWTGNPRLVRSRRDSSGVRRGNIAIAAMLAMTLSLSAPWAGRFALATAIPVWLVQFAILWLAFTRMPRPLVWRPSQRPDTRGAELLDAALASGPTQPSTENPAGAGHQAVDVAERSSNPKAMSRLLTLGPPPRSGRLGYAKASAQIAAVIAIIPVAYMIWTTLAELGNRFNTNTGILIVALSALLELSRWVISGFVFGYVYAKLPGRIGPVKALSFAAVWIVSCIGPLAIAQALSGSFIQQTIYRSAQFALFAIVLAVVIDLKTVLSAGGNWRDLRRVYDLQGLGDVS